MNQRRQAFTLIELIIVVVIIGILALVAIPRYFANVDKAKKIQAWHGLEEIRRAERAYYAVYGTYTTSSNWPITVIVDGDTIVNLNNPSTSTWTFYRNAAPYYESYALLNPYPSSGCRWHVYFNNNERPDKIYGPSCPG